MIGMSDGTIFDGPSDILESSAPWNDLVQEDFHIAVYRDRYPVTPGHLLFVPKYNSAQLLNQAFEDAFRYGRNKVDNAEWDGFNIGLNYNEAAGQTVPWPHIHLIPRHRGDCKDPIGGVRGVIAGQANYRSTEYQNPVK
jgi:diadenosine tetraphosphate (Ap4A) HIT family hydrolase